MLNILYEDEDIVVINKPGGIAVHPAQHNSGEETLVAEILKRWPEIKDVGDPSAGGLRPGIAHRLDKETSGVLVVAKNRSAFEYLKKQFQERRVAKTYIALVIGKMPGSKGEVRLAIRRSRKFGKFTAYPLKPFSNSRELGYKKKITKLREAITKWRTLAEYQTAAGEILTLLEIIPETGRTHQIRVHLAAIGHPVVGDALYGGKAAKKYRAELSRHFLHASSLELNLPSASRAKFEADLPDDLAAFLQNLTQVQNE
jgi:23S rRNA pseudouridine1911/1915/1917 synthase